MEPVRLICDQPGRGGVRHEATADEMALDAKALGILSGNLILALQELFDLEKEYALRKAAVLRKYRRKK
jgi:hypothetical protein